MIKDYIMNNPEVIMQSHFQKFKIFFLILKNEKLPFAFIYKQTEFGENHLLKTSSKTILRFYIRTPKQYKFYCESAYDCHWDTASRCP